jgi:type IV secretion system protein VirB7
MPPLRRPPALALLCLAAQCLSGCASLAGQEPPVCDGRHRRPANPYGSVLAPTPQTPSPDDATPATGEPIPGPPSSPDQGDGGCA